MHGRGVMLWPDGARYEGQWNQSKRHGQGVLTETSSTSYDAVYDGEWQDGLQHGHGLWRAAPAASPGAPPGSPGAPPGDVLVTFEGRWQMGLKNGKGVATFMDGSSYDGQYLQGVPHGHGVWRAGPVASSDGQGAPGEVLVTYEGSWSTGLREGEGLATFADGSSYGGEYLQGVPHGHGRFRWRDGTELAGEWIEGEQRGTSTVVFANGTKYDGEYCQLLYSQKRSHTFTRFTRFASMRIGSDGLEEEDDASHVAHCEIAGQDYSQYALPNVARGMHRLALQLLA